MNEQVLLEPIEMARVAESNFAIRDGNAEVLNMARSL
jgi:hypothetical protein